MTTVQKVPGKWLLFTTISFFGFCLPAFAVQNSTFKTGYAYDAQCTTFYQNSAEVPQRVSWINKRLKEQGLLEKMYSISPVSDPLEWIRKVHTQEHIDKIKSIPIATDQGATKPVGEIADLAASYVLGAVRDVCEGKVNNAFAAIRPPGHHVENEGSLIGFCAYANVVIAARYAREKYNINKILFIDWDYHYGNGTEYFIQTEKNSFLLEFGYGDQDDSSSQSNAEGVHVVTKAVGQGTNDEFETVLREYLVPKMKTFSPELIIISCGFDLKKNDGLGSFKVTAQGISRLTKIVMQIAQEHCKGKIVSILEGGYRDQGSSPETFYGLSQCAENHVKTLMTGEIQPETPYFKEVQINSKPSFKQHNLFIIKNNTLYFNQTSTTPTSVSLYNTQGRLLWNKELTSASSTMIPLGNNLSLGSYIVRVQFNKDHNISHSFIVTQ